MASIRVIKVKGSFNKKSPKIAFFHKKDFDDYTTKRYGKYNVVTIGKDQYNKYWDNKEKAYRATVRFHKS